ncbi:PP2 domain-containing protein, partial [Salmonella enterica subsp. enterica serovar Typhimurium]|nr:PP2 domain-containing protein [Salmonella enterica subsp. enterica serovar Typhimurium]
MAQAVRHHDIHSLWSHGGESKQLHSPSQNKMSIVGQMSARDLSIVWGSDTRYWKWSTEEIGGQCVEVAELIDVCWLQIDGSYAVQKLTEGMHYEVKFVVKLKDNLNITNPVDLTLTLPDGTKQQHKEKLMEMPRDQILGITAGVFQASKMCGCGDIKFSMMNTDPTW